MLTNELNFDVDGCNKSWDRGKIKVKRLFKLDYPTLLKQSTSEERLSL